MNTGEITILKTIVGSQAHGLATPESDTDYRGVFVIPTSEILKLGGHKEQTSWIEGKDDDTSWEVGHFLNLAVHCNPTILETFLAPVVLGNEDKYYDHWKWKLRDLFPYVWNSNDVKNAFIGYGLNQRKKFLDAKDGKPQKFACAYLRTLYQAQELLYTGTFTIKISDTIVGETLKRWKSGNWGLGEVIEICAYWEEKVRKAYELNPDKKTDMEPINDFLLRLRKEMW